MSQRDGRPQEQSLCFTVHTRQSQYSHQIHLRWFTSRTIRAAIQMRICVRDTTFNVSARVAGEQWAGRPNLAGRRSQKTEMGRNGPTKKPFRPDRSNWCLERAAAPADAAGKEADQPDERENRRHDEEPVDDETDAERDDREDRKTTRSSISSSSFSARRGGLRR